MRRQPTELTRSSGISEARLRYVIPSLNLAIQILKYLSKTKNKTATLTQISSDFKINRSTTYRILTTLQLNNMVEYDPLDKSYRLGSEVVVLGARAVALNDFLRKAEQIIQRVARETGCTTVFVQRIAYDKIAYVLKAEPDTPIHMSASLGQVFPITAGSHGKLFLAYMDDEERQDILSRNGYPRYTEYTISTENLEEELVKSRSTGCAISWEEHYPGVAGVAVPVFRTGENLVGTISCITMTASITRERLKQLGEMIKRLVETELY